MNIIQFPSMVDLSLLEKQADLEACRDREVALCAEILAIGVERARLREIQEARWNTLQLCRHLQASLKLEMQVAGWIDWPAEEDR